MPMPPARCVRGCDYEYSRRLEDSPALSEKAMGIMDVFDDVSHRDRIEGHVVETGALQLTLMHLELSRSRAAYCDWVCFNARDRPAHFAHRGHKIARAAADVEQ